MLDIYAQPLISVKGPMGVQIDVVPSFLMLAAMIMFFNPSVGQAVFVVMIAVSILLHELGHAWGAKVQGVPVQRVLLWGGGGLCFHGGTTDLRKRELIVAMGPLTNLALWALASLAAMWLYDNAPPYAGGTSLSHEWQIAGYLDQFSQINLFLFALNMLPIQPLDGGKLFYLFMSRVIPSSLAGRIAGGLGLVICALWIPAMVYAFLTWGLVLFFIPSFRAHIDIAKGRALP